MKNDIENLMAIQDEDFTIYQMVQNMISVDPRDRGDINGYI